MQTRIRGWIVGAGVIAAAGCAGQHVSTDYSPTIDFGGFHSFTLVTQPDSGGQQLLDDRVARAVQGQLTAKGLTLTDRAKASLYVGYGVVDHTHTRVYTAGTGWGWGAGRGWRYHRWGVAWPVMMQRDVETYTDGTVVVNLVDAKTKRVVWRGEVADVLNLPVGDPAEATRQIDSAVAKMFASYPPLPAGGSKGGVS